MLASGARDRFPVAPDRSWRATHASAAQALGPASVCRFASFRSTTGRHLAVDHRCLGSVVDSLLPSVVSRFGMSGVYSSPGGRRSRRVLSHGMLRKTHITY